ncbi:MAG: hypothetical protein UU47_C0007G0002 [candidate division TM6 bacterium GW2011_GWE2_41_16]|nr:MAG: hypothetical protein UU47_C0007G0002 [candidate division TM6 bacterium GW2011_GWE2_41_16]
MHFNRFKKYLNVLLCILFIAGTLSTYATNLNNLKGTVSILPPELRDVSLLEGAVAWESGFVRQLYDFGPMRSYEPIKRGAESIKDYRTILNKDYKKWEKKITSPIARLVHAYFYRVPGTMAASEFVLGKDHREASSKNLIHRLVPQITMLWLQKFIAPNGPLFFEKSGQIKEIVEMLTKKQPDPFFPNFCCHEQTPRIGNQGGGGSSNPQTDVLFNVLNDILLAALWNKCTELEDIRWYYETLKKELLSKIQVIHKAITVLPTAQKTTLSPRVEKAQKIVESFQGVLAQQKNVIEPFDYHLGEDIKKQAFAYTKADLMDPVKYEQFVYASLLKIEGPTDTTYGYASLSTISAASGGQFIKILEQGKDIVFTDCTENMMRNFFNHILWTTAGFNADLLKQYTGKEPRAEILGFYEKHKNPSLAGERQAHDDWTAVVSNIPYVVYNEYKSNQTIQTTPTTTGYMFVPSGTLQPFFENQGYVIVPEGSAVLYNLEANCHNIILLMDHVLNLGLFAGKDIALEVQRPDFIEQYLPVCFKYFGQIKESPQDIQEAQKKHTTIHLDVALTSVARFGRAAYPVTLTIDSGGHGFFDSVTKTDSGNIPLFWQRQDFVALENLLPSLQYLVPTSICLEWMDKNFITELWFYNTFFAQPIAIPDLAFALSKKSSFYPQTFIDLSEFLISRNADPSVRLNQTLQLYTHAFRSVQNYIRTIAIAQAGSQSSDFSMREDALFLFRSLVEIGQGYPESITAAQKNIQSFDLDDRRESLDLFKTLFEKGQGYPEAIVAAQTGLQSSDSDVQEDAIRLFMLLVENGQGYREAIVAGQKGMQIPDKYVQKASIKLFKALVKKGQGYPEAIAAVQNVLQNTNPEIEKLIQELHDQLKAQKQAL